jgi:BASS family bile acid:Na+ symporter
VVGSQSFSDPKVVVMVVVVAIVSLLILMPLSRKLARHQSGEAESPAAVQQKLDVDKTR